MERGILMNAAKHLVKEILEYPERKTWTLQGFGMLRTYLSPEVRLHIWDDRYRNSDVSMMHTHPWHFHSYVVAGSVRNLIYVEVEGEADPYNRQTIQCGEGGGKVGEPETVGLVLASAFDVREGEEYSQDAHEIHMSEPDNGTITIIEREFLDDTEHAYVYWEKDKEWITAEPRLATDDEIEAITQYSLDRWF